MNEVMDILHLCLCGPVTDSWNYQENLLTKYHKKLGHTVTIITSRWIWNNKGEMTLSEKTDYINEDGVRTIRLPIRGKNRLDKKFKKYDKLYASISQVKPEIIFIHGCQFVDMKQVVKYIKNFPEIQVYVDNHSDFFNSATNWVSKNILHKIIWKKYAKDIEPYTEKFYGVSPARVNFLIDMYKINKKKVELLVLGADDEKVEEARSTSVVNEVRAKYNIKQDDFLIITGGKIDKNKRQILLLMKSVAEIKKPNVKLLVFGSVDPQYKEEFNSLLNESIVYTGWINPEHTYRYFYAADLIVFPGLHSVFWEQAVGLGKPCVFKYIEGFDHVDLNGNCRFLFSEKISEMKELIIEIINNKKMYKDMERIAMSKGIIQFSYKNIAEKSIQSNQE
ncbi:glycosyltransferase family 4 protein [Planococcus sp. YIM B11945]|uniref:glycosyltransferase family 4 protein n=1 Tax=Planococcus sp. YIM B11945 TaxID=3435410 RepID=UPI003D7DC834